MKTYQIYPNAELSMSVDADLEELQVMYQDPEAENIMASGGSSQVLDDFLEFTDFLIPFKMISRHSKTDDYYTAFSSL